LTWNGRTDAGSGVADGVYNVIVTARDLAGNASLPHATGVVVYRALSNVAASTTLFYPQDRDTYAPSTRLSFTLTAPTTVTWTINGASGAIVATRYANVAFPARTLAWVWNGKNDGGAYVASGTYTATLTATNGVLSDTSRTTLTVAAFAISTATATAVRGQNIAVTVVSAEPLAAAPSLTIGQPGVAARTVTLSKAGANTWRVTTRLSPKGSAGNLTLKVVGIDARKGSNVATAVVPLR
jgi:flagellar hook assembly protein FlgD